MNLLSPNSLTDKNPALNKIPIGVAGGLVHQLPNPKPLMTDQATVTTPSETKAHPAVPSPWVYQCGTTPQANPPLNTLEPLRCTICFLFLILFSGPWLGLEHTSNHCLIFLYLTWDPSLQNFTFKFAQLPDAE